MGAGGAGACAAGAAWKEAGSLASAWTPDPPDSCGFLCALADTELLCLAFHDNFANILSEAPVACTGEVTCLLLAASGKA